MSKLDANRVWVRVQTRPAVHLSVIDAGPRGASPVLFFVQGAGGNKGDVTDIRLVATLSSG